MNDVKNEVKEILEGFYMPEEHVAGATERLMRVIEQVAQTYHARGVAMQSRAIRIRLGVEVPGDHN